MSILWRIGWLLIKRDSLNFMKNIDHWSIMLKFIIYPTKSQTQSPTRSLPSELSTHNSSIDMLFNIVK